MKKFLALLLTAMMFLSAIPCAVAEDSATANLIALFDQVKDSSELPDWTGEKLNLRVWHGHGNGGSVYAHAEQDVVSPEVERIFGITVDPDNSFDNGGFDLPSKVTMLAATNDWPEIGTNVLNNDLINNGILLDLTDLLPKYAPHVWALMNALNHDGVVRGVYDTGRIYSIPYEIGNTVANMSAIYGDKLDVDKYSVIALPTEATGVNSAIYVREDILQLAYPDLPSDEELQAKYMSEEGFTKDDIYCMGITTYEQAIEFFYKIAQTIKDNDIKTADGKPVYATYVNTGADNWALFSGLLNHLWGGLNTNYFTYFNGETQKVELMLENEDFKSFFNDMRKFVLDGVAPEACLLENSEMFTNRLNNGEYAIAYAWNVPNAATLAEQGLSYRRVFFDIEKKDAKYVNIQKATDLKNGLSIFSWVPEEQVKRILAWYDFMATEVGMNLACWGPKTAGLWDYNENGERRFTDKDVEDCCVYGVANGKDVYYNLLTANNRGTWPCVTTKLILSGGICSPKYVYDVAHAEKVASNWKDFYVSGLYDTFHETAPAVMDPSIWNFTNPVPSVKEFWDLRMTGFEPLMTKCLATRTDEEFEAAWQNMLDFCHNNGLNQEALDAINEYVQTEQADSYAIWCAGEQ